jgi:hypothetical protein
MFDRLLNWLQEFVDGPTVNHVPLEVRIISLAEAWNVTVESARQIAYSYALQRGVEIASAVDELCGMEYAEVLTEIGEH